MFTGLVEHIGAIRRIEQGGQSLKLHVDCPLPADAFVLGESIAVNGVCLTVVSFGDGWFCADVSPETWRVTALGKLASGSRVNLERALRLGDRLGGHLVSGHVDALGRLTQRRQDANAVMLGFSLDSDVMRYLIHKGSVCIDGVSLTVAELQDEGFTVAVIPHTLEQTALQYLRVGDAVNIETDLIGKYVERLLGSDRGKSPAGDRISLDFLGRNGFL